MITHIHTQQPILALPYPTCDRCGDILSDEEITAPHVNRFGERMCETCDQYFYYCTICDEWILDESGHRCHHVFWDHEGNPAGVGSSDLDDYLRYDNGADLKESFLTAIRIANLHWPILIALRSGRLFSRIDSRWFDQTFEVRFGTYADHPTKSFMWESVRLSDTEIVERAEAAGLDECYVADCFQWLWGLGDDTQEMNFRVAGWIYEDLIANNH